MGVFSGLPRLLWVAAIPLRLREGQEAYRQTSRITGQFSHYSFIFIWKVCLSLFRRGRQHRTMQIFVFATLPSALHSRIRRNTCWCRNVQSEETGIVYTRGSGLANIAGKILHKLADSRYCSLFFFSVER